MVNGPDGIYLCGICSTHMSWIRFKILRTEILKV